MDGRADAQAVSIVVSDVLTLAERYYESGDAGMGYLPMRARWAILVASRLYRGIGRRLRRRYDNNPLRGRVVVPWLSKLGLVASATWSWLWSAVGSASPQGEARRVAPPSPSVAQGAVGRTTGGGGRVV